MFIKEQKVKQAYWRKSKLGKSHCYYRNTTFCYFRCDNCGDEFVRQRGKMDPKRISNDFFHVCSNCDAKRFAQRKGVEWKKVWDLNASSDIDISKI